MMNTSGRFLAKFIILILLFYNISHESFSQINDSIRVPLNLGAAVTLTTKGISTIPNLTLGKPAVIFDLSVGRRLAFEPQLRFALEGKPWSFLFWWRYKLLQTGKIRLNIGAHPALSFKSKTSVTDGVTTENMMVYRYLAGELSPVFLLSKNVSIGAYYLYSRGIEKALTRNTNLIAFKSNFSNIRITDQFSMGFYPQIYYLKMDKHDGYYLNSSVTIGRNDFPVSLTGMINKRLESNIPADNDFIWNVSLRYAFSKEYVRR